MSKERYQSMLEDAGAIAIEQITGMMQKDRSCTTKNLNANIEIFLMAYSQLNDIGAWRRAERMGA